MKTRSRRGSKKVRSMTGQEMARLVARAAADNKAEDVVILRVSELVNYTDYFVVASGHSTRQTRAIADKIGEAIASVGGSPLGVEGERESNWILVDWGDVVAHVFYKPVREFYGIEKLYGDAEVEEVE